MPYKRGCQDIHEMAEFLDVTEEYLEEAIDCYTEKYGEFAKVNNYTVFFIPESCSHGRVAKDASVFI